MEEFPTLPDAETCEHYRLLVENSLDGIYLIQDGCFIYANPEFLRIFGYTAEQLAGRPVLDLVAEEDHDLVREGVRRREAGEEQRRRYEFRGRRADGSIIDLEVISTHVTRRGGGAIQGSLRDITERKRLQAQLIAAERHGLLGQIAGSIGHEIGNIVAGLTIYCDLMKRHLDEPDRIRHLTDIFATQVERLSIHVDNLLTLGRPRAVKFEPLEPAAILDESTNLLVESGVLKHVTIVRQYAPRLPLVVGDRNQLIQIFTNLGINAAHAMDEGGTLVLSINPTPAGDFLEIAVQDDGCGIPPENVQRLFEPFYTTKGEGKGTGLGLAVVRQIVEGHGGDIALESVPSGGTRVVIRLRATKAEED